ncbi:ABC-F family ATP-binding cassette domain-containing protein [Halobacillus fulvus]|nr:ABC-F family ATP-binding cassette domain-containing protein [Halobacillus fulvus]
MKVAFVRFVMSGDLCLSEAIQGGFFVLLMRAKNIEYSIGDRQILSIPEIAIHEGEKIGLVGKNGQGKTLLFRYLMEDLDVRPQVEWMTSVSWLKQLSEEMEKASYSGGEKTLHRLKKVFEESRHLLLLDEPTNNLDFKHVEELERKLIAHQGSMLIASHDRMLLNQVCTKIWELDQGTITVYSGNYSFYEKQKEIERKQQNEKYQQYSDEKKRLKQRMKQKHDQSKGMRKPPKRMGNSEWQLGKNKAAAKQKKVERVSKTLERRLDRLEKVDKPFEWDEVKMSFEQGDAVHHKYLCQFREESISRNGRKLLDIPQASLPNKARVALIGNNGSGKTTLLNDLIHQPERFPNQVDVAYFNQNLESLPIESTVFDYASESSPLSESMVRIILARLRFYEQDMNKRIAVLSGGERVKLALARLLTRRAQLMILDEPTNHLDFEAIQALEQLVLDYPGAVLYVTHDRTFIQKTADRLWVIESGVLQDFEGTWEDWTNRHQQREAAEDAVYDQLTLENRLTELIGKLSMPTPKDDPIQLEEEYQRTLKQLRSFKS